MTWKTTSATPTAFNARDYDAVFDFYAENPRMAFFGMEITSRDELKRFYGFLHQYVKGDPVTDERFAGSDELPQSRRSIRIEGIADPHARNPRRQRDGAVFSHQSRRGSGDAAVHSLSPEGW